MSDADQILSAKVIREVEDSAQQAIDALPAYLRTATTTTRQGSTELRFSEKETA